uniref:Uncharacterized protein n=1 Tax=Arundo donax TaxID=35708 RepID=A0A0A9AUT8_ARUDO
MSFERKMYSCLRITLFFSTFAGSNSP